MLVLNGFTTTQFRPTSDVIRTFAIDPATISALTTNAPLLDIARATVQVVNAVNAWRPNNGYCLAWPPAARVARDGEDARTLLRTFMEALNKTSHPNGWPNLGGGGLEQIGTLDAIHVLLLQSHEGVLRLFPAWPRDTPAAFERLRAEGAFVVSAEMVAGSVANVRITSDVGRNCVVVNPFSTNMCVVETYPRHASVVTHVVGDGRYMFETVAGGEYEVLPC